MLRIAPQHKRISIPTVAIAAAALLAGAVPSAAAGFSISGTVTYEGEPLKRYPLLMVADSNCA